MRVIKKLRLNHDYVTNPFHLVSPAGGHYAHVKLIFAWKTLLFLSRQQFEQLIVGIAFDACFDVENRDRCTSELDGLLGLECREADLALKTIFTGKVRAKGKLS